jgi:formate dehydrogenase major subunit
MIRISINGTEFEAVAGSRLIDAINHAGIHLPQVCYHTQLGPIQTCDTCIVEVNGELVRSCAALVASGMRVSTSRPEAQAARTEAFDRILTNHELYCTVCDNNNGNCTVHNTTKLLAVEHQHYPFQAKPYEVDNSNPFYRYDPNQCILCGRCVSACQNRRACWNCCGG